MQKQAAFILGSIKWFAHTIFSSLSLIVFNQYDLKTPILINRIVKCIYCKSIKGLGLITFFVAAKRCKNLGNKLLFQFKNAQISQNHHAKVPYDLRIFSLDIGWQTSSSEWYEYFEYPDYLAYKNTMEGYIHNNIKSSVVIGLQLVLISLLSVAVKFKN